MSIKSKTHKGTGFNELRFEDKKGEEEIYVHAEKDYRRLIKNNEIVKIEGELKVNVIQASEKKAKSIQITANDFIEFNLGANQIKMTPTQITVAGKNVSIKGQAMTTIQGGMVKINAGGGGASQAKTNLENMAVGAKTGEFEGFKANVTKEFGINKSVEPVQVASSGSQVPDDFGSGAIEPIFSPLDVIETMVEGTPLEQVFDFLPTSKNIKKNITGWDKNSENTEAGSGKIGGKNVEPSSTLRAKPKRKPWYRDDLDDKWFDPKTGDLKWPPNDGFAPGTRVSGKIEAGSTVDRFSASNPLNDNGNVIPPKNKRV